MRFFSAISHFLRQSNTKTNESRRQGSRRRILGLEVLEDRVHPSVAPTLLPITPNPDVVAHSATPSAIALNAVDNDPGTSLTFTTTLLDPLLAIKNQYGLTSSLDGLTNSRGQNEKYLVSGNNSNSPSNVYILMPTGNLYAWNGALNTTLASTPVANVGAAVYYNPALLTTNTGQPIVTSGTNPLYDLKVQYGLVSPTLPGATNLRKGNEEYLVSSNGSNSAWGGTYVLLPNDKLYAYEGTDPISISSTAPYGTIADSTLAMVADLTPYGNVYANPSLLTNASLPTAVGVNAVVTTPPSGGSLQLTALPGFDRSVQVTVNVSDGILSTSQSFTFTVNNTAPTVASIGPLTTPHDTALTPFNLNAMDAQSDPLTYTPSATVVGVNPLYSIKVQLGLTYYPNLYNQQKGGEKWFVSNNSSNAPSHAYVLLSNEKLYAWDGVSLATTTMQTPVADFSQPSYAAYGNVYATPTLLSNAQQLGVPTVPVNSGLLYNVKEQLGLNTADLSGAFNQLKANEKWFVSSNGSNAPSYAYVLMPTGMLYAWDGISLATTIANAPAADLSSAGVYANTSLLYAAQATTINDHIYAAREQYGLDTADLYTGPSGEKYLLSSNNSNPAGGNTYVLMPSDKLYAWDGKSLATTIAQPAVFDFTPYGNVYQTPALLYGDLGQVPAISATVNNAGLVTLTQDPRYIGTAQITARVSDSAEFALPSFQFSATDTAPVVVAAPNPVVVAHNAAAPGFKLNVTDGESDPLTYGVQVTGYSPIYNLQVQLGLTQPAYGLNFHGMNEKYLASTNGSNPAGGGVYVLYTDNKLYQWDNVSLATTLLTTPVFDFSPYGNVYANPALLYKATAPLATVAANRGPAYDIREQFGLNTPDLTAAFNQFHTGEKYFVSSNGSNPGGAGVFVLLPSGKLYAWDGTSLATTIGNTPVADLSSEGAYANTSLLYAAQPVFIADPVYNVKKLYGLNAPDVKAAFNQGSMGEKYFVSSNGSNAPSHTYVLMPTNQLYAWDGVSLATTIAKTPIFDFTTVGVDVYDNTALLYGDTGQVPAVTASVDSSGNVTLTPNVAFAGTVRVGFTISDGAKQTTTSTLLTVTNGAPTINPINVPAGANPTAIPISTSDPENDPLQFVATIQGYNPLYKIKTQFGLSTQDLTGSYNQFHMGEKYLLSSNQSNPAGNFVYVLLPNNLLYAWDGISLSTTIAHAPVADLSPYTITYGNVYANPALLYNATLPTAPAVTANFTNTSTSGATLNLVYPPAFSGTFQVTVTVSDGANEVQQTILAPNNAPIVSKAVSDQTVSAGSSPTQIDLAGHFTDVNTTNSEVTYNITNGTTTEALNVTLFDTTAPQTVANFLDYVRAGNFNNNIFSRLQAGFVLQGGGLALNSAGNNLTAISKRPAVPNEYGASNVANTLSMALSGGDINGGTDQFYFNLADNSSSLNPQSFTVFGQLADTNSQTALAALATTPVKDESATAFAAANPAFLLNSVPLTNYSGSNFPSDATTSNFMVINNITVDKQTEYLTYSATSSNPGLVTASTNNEWLTLNYVPHQTGTATIAVTATDLYGITITQTFKVTVNPSPPSVNALTIAIDSASNTTKLTAQPTATDPQGRPVTFTYQWLKNNTPIPGATSATLSLPGVGLSPNDQLVVQVTPNDGLLSGSVATSNTITIATVSPTTIAPPTITQIVIAPDSATHATTLTAQPTATPDPLGQGLYGNYQWLKNNNPIPGATSPTLNLNTVTFNPGDQFSIRMTATDGTFTSPSFTSFPITVATTGSAVTFNPPTIQSLTIASDNTSNATVITGTLKDSSPASYGAQWFKNGQAINGQNSLSLSLAGLGLKTGDVITLEADLAEGPLYSTISTSNSITITGTGPITTT